MLIDVNSSNASTALSKIILDCSVNSVEPNSKFIPSTVDSKIAQPTSLTTAPLIVSPHHLIKVDLDYWPIYGFILRPLYGSVQRSYLNICLPNTRLNTQVHSY